ncbi:hypothetical protein LCGC14_0702970 [marine sediment metagenome]|uniref:Uncharacterized protein n=1 Tax=marine sediment metagenome TaxID=412755 RepID=A0A0F9R2Q7_9ZZZZ
MTITFGDATQAPVPIQIGTQKFVMAPLTFADWGEIERTAKSRVLALAHTECRVAVTIEDKSAIMAAATAEARLITASDTTSIVSSVESMVDMMWLSLRKSAPGMERERAEWVLGDLQRGAELTNRLLLLSLRLEVADDESTDDKKEAATGEVNPSTSEPCSAASASNTDGPPSRLAS